jgi:hypothetical protein
MSEELLVKCKSGLSVASFDGEGIVFDMETRKYYVTNETAAFLITFLKEEQEGLYLSSVKKSLLEEYQTNDEKVLDNDLELFLHNLEKYGLGSLESGNGDNGNITVRNSEVKPRRIYTKPAIEEELNPVISGRQVVDLLTDVSSASVAREIAKIIG